MAAIRLAKSPGYVQTTSRLWMARFSNTAKGTNAVAEGRNVTSVLPETTGRETKNNARTNEAKGQAQNINDDDRSGTTGFAPDTARQGAIKAMYAAEADDVMQEMDSAYDVTTETTQDVKDTIVAEADNNVVETTEYRSIQDAAKHDELD